MLVLILIGNTPIATPGISTPRIIFVQTFCRIICSWYFLSQQKNYDNFFLLRQCCYFSLFQYEVMSCDKNAKSTHYAYMGYMYLGHSPQVEKHVITIGNRFTGLTYSKYMTCARNSILLNSDCENPWNCNKNMQK